VRAIDWMYHRKGCKTCERAQNFLTKHKVKQPEFVDARKDTLSKKDALRIARESQEILSARGTKVVHLNLRGTEVADKDIEAVVIGPTGNLRAPAFKVGKTLVIGFNEGAYKQVLEG
jgi:arsenate reductase-like glutaredoxin family protein